MTFPYPTFNQKCTTLCMHVYALSYSAAASHNKTKQTSKFMPLYPLPVINTAGYYPYIPWRRTHGIRPRLCVLGPSLTRPLSLRIRQKTFFPTTNPALPENVPQISELACQLNVNRFARWICVFYFRNF